MGKTPQDGIGNGQAAWAALNNKFDGSSKEARREFHDKLHNTTMQSGDDPEDFLFIMDGYLDRLDEMGQGIPDERYEDIILRARPAEYERVRVASCERRDFNLTDLRHMISTMYTDYLSRPDAINLVAGRGVAMEASGSRDSRRNRTVCFRCGKRGHVKRNCR
ncbi:unnamed protein product, partial [Sphacelaria rigidula]